MSPYPAKSGAALSFEGGNLVLNLRGYPDPGSGQFAFTDDDLEPVREYDEDGVWDGFLVKLPSSELLALRDFLNKYLSPAASALSADTAGPTEQSALPRETNKHLPWRPDREAIARVINEAMNAARKNPTFSKAHTKGWCAAHDQAVAAILALGSQGWRDIESAPKDGDAILAWGPEYGFHYVFYDRKEDDGSGVWTAKRERFLPRSEWCWSIPDGAQLHENAFTHWQPLPPPPSGARR